MKKPWIVIGLVVSLPLWLSFAESRAATQPAVVPPLNAGNTGIVPQTITPAPYAPQAMQAPTNEALPMAPQVSGALNAVGTPWGIPPNLSSGIEAPLSRSEKKALLIANDWKDASQEASHGNDGAVVFPYGAALPTVICAPLYACNIKLQTGESITSNHLGDSARWESTPVQGPNNTTIVVIKPHDSGLQTDLTLTTDRHVYVIKLISRTQDWMPLVSFSYPEDTNAVWARYYASVRAKKAATVIPSTGQNVAKLDFGFRVSGAQVNWRPTRVYTDGTKTYIQFPSAVHSSDIPALVLIGPDKSEQLVNYRMVGNAYVVDGVISQAALISGVGRYQSKVTITRDRGA